MSFINSFRKLNRNKKGFSLVELLVAVAIIAIVTPFLVEGFIQASRLNYRSRLQQRADEAANSVYEGIASLKYEDLEHYLSNLNGWEPVTDGTGDGYAYYVSKPYDELEDCEVKVSVQKYSEAYLVPDLNFIGVESKYLTLASEINKLDSVAAEKLEQAIKADEEVKKAVVQNIVATINGTYGATITSSQIDRSKILIDCGDISRDKISKQTSVYLDVVGDKFIAEYETSYRYPAEVPNPNVDTATLKVSYTYAHNLNGKWISVSNDSLDVQESLKAYYNNDTYKYQFKMSAVSESVSVRAEKNDDGLSANQTMFMYYDPVSKMDWIDIKAGRTTGYEYNVFFIEQSTLGDDGLRLESVCSSAENNFMFSSQNKPTNDYTVLTQGDTSVNLYSNNSTIAKNGIPDSIYESSEAETNMYRVQVSVTYQSTVFAEVSGEFKAGGGTVGQYSGS